MGDVFPRFKAAAIQAAPVFLDRDASVEKACLLIEKAGQNGAELIVLPEVFIPGGPYWAWHMSMGEGLKFSAELYQNSVDVPSDSTARIGERAKKYGVYVVIGINERENKSIYNTLLFFDTVITSRKPSVISASTVWYVSSSCVRLPDLALRHSA